MGNVCSALCNQSEKPATVVERKPVKTIDNRLGLNSKVPPKTLDEPKIVPATGGYTDKLQQEDKSQQKQTPTNSTNPLDSFVSSNPSNRAIKVGLEDFDNIKEIGKGAFGKVLLVKKKNTGNLYAMKIVSKAMFESNNSSLENAMVEREVLMKSRHPFVVSLKYSFQNKFAVYYVMDYVAGGQLYQYVKKMKKFNTSMARFYTAEVLLGLRHLHLDLDTMYRDLKPENILV